LQQLRSELEGKGTAVAADLEEEGGLRGDPLVGGVLGDLRGAGDPLLGGDLRGKGDPRVDGEPGGAGGRCAGVPLVGGDLRSDGDPGGDLCTKCQQQEKKVKKRKRGRRWPPPQQPSQQQPSQQLRSELEGKGAAVAGDLEEEGDPLDLAKPSFWDAHQSLADRIGRTDWHTCLRLATLKDEYLAECRSHAITGGRCRHLVRRIQLLVAEAAAAAVGTQ